MIPLRNNCTHRCGSICAADKVIRYYVLRGMENEYTFKQKYSVHVFNWNREPLDDMDGEENAM